MSNFINFKVTKIDDIRKHGSVLQLGIVYQGELSSCNKKIYWTDNNDIEWIFYIGDTCELVEN